MTVRTVRLALALLIEVLFGFAAAALFVRVVSAGNGPGPSVFAVAVVVLASFWLARLLQLVDIDETQARTIAVLASVIALTTIVHIEYAPSHAPWQLGWVRDLVIEPRGLLAGRTEVAGGAVALTLLWLRGIVRGRAPVDFEGVRSSVAVGLVAIAVAAVASPAVHGPSGFGPIAVLYFVLALCALALYQTGDPDEAITTFAMRWSAAFAVLVGASIVLTIVAAAVDPGSLGVLAPLGKPLVFVLTQLGLYVLGPIAGGIAFLFGLIPLHHPPTQPAMPQPPPLAPKPDNGSTPLWFQIVGYVFVGSGVLVLGLSVLAAIWLLMRRFARRKPGVTEQRRVVEHDSMLGEDLAALFDGIGRRFRRTGHVRSAVDVRRLYHEMLSRAEDDGIGRPLSKTPLQFAPELDAHYSSDVPSSISRAFVASRYGLVPFDERVVRELRERWGNVADRTVR